ncbi:3-oxoacyl-[acyl-carrier protein] reductase [Actinokineospora baliensis]|uniref:SDR family NAD(P)-dependent oxidoreductase n=1 Tax=Actinokineospora baliensis TaxID=547056 RepID=UPI0027DC1766|nr:SDR family oxidoreductase [Actinokineospora baliensis]MBM7774781.1 3-oxoacyl-[acyl-carrier protein] reductase [Actinokineospora baliensis]
MSEPTVAVVSGGGTGIGKAIAARLALANEVVILGRRADVLAEAAAELGPRVHARQVDVSAKDAVVAFAEWLRAEHGRVDVVLNNAGYLLPVTLADIEAGEANLDEVLGANLKGAYLLTAALRDLLSSPGGRVVNISSIAGYSGGSGAGAAQAYAAAKAGLTGLSFGMARELGPLGITVNVVAPGFIADTGFTTDFPAERQRWLAEQTVVGRAGHVDDVAHAVEFLASAQASFISGHVLHVNGGWLFGR